MTFSGVGEIDVVDVPNTSDGKVNKREIWHAKWNGEDETRPYVAVNGVTIDFKEDLDLAVLTEEKRVQYFDGRSVPEKELDAKWDRPHYGGCY